MARTPRIALIGALWMAAPALGAAPAVTAPLDPVVPRAIQGAHYPAPSPDGQSICFSYRGDIWTAPSAGGTAARLTVHRAYDGWPRWSPDGNWIAFSSNRTGNYDIFLIPARGGDARQLTFHASDDMVADWSPDGSMVMFTSNRDGRFADLYTIGVADRRVRRLTRDGISSRYPVFEPGGTSVLYARGLQPWWRPRYTGSQRLGVYRLDTTTLAAEPVARAGGMVSWPMPAPDGLSLYAMCDRGDSANIWQIGRDGRDIRQVTRHAGHLQRYPAIARDGSCIVYESGFRLWIAPLPAGEPHPVEITAPTDVAANTMDRLNLTSGVGSAALSADGASLALGLRGEIWTLKAEGGDARQLTHTPALDDDPTWSADGGMLAYVTDRFGGLDIMVADAKSGKETRVTSDRADDEQPEFAPDGKLLAFVRTGGSAPGLYAVDAVAAVAGKGPAAEPYLVAPGMHIGSLAWSPDARWLAYTRRDATYATDVWIVRAAGGPPVNVTRYPGFSGSPQWTRDGKRLVFVAARDGVGSGATANLFSVELAPEPPAEDTADAPASQAGPGRRRRSQDDAPDGAPEAQRRRSGPPAAPADAPAGPAAAGPIPPRATLVRIDFDGIEKRARQITSLREPLGRFALAPDSRAAVFTLSIAGRTGWWAADIETGALSPMGPGAEPGDVARFAPDGGSFVYLGAGGSLNRLARGAMASTAIALSARFELDRRAEMAEAFNQAWRTLNTQFYDRSMHGVDWQGLRARYEPLLAETYEPEDLSWLLCSMIGELNASHMGATPPARPGPAVETAYLGLTFDQDYRGPGLRIASVLPKGPADQPGHRLQPGWTVHSIDGTDVAWGEDLFKLLSDRVGQNLELLVSNGPSRDAARTVKVKPIARAEFDNLEYDRWVEARRKTADALSGGKVAYLHIRAMDTPSLRRFERELLGDAQPKQGLVIDVRNNGGGRIHDDLLALLVRRPHSYETPRDGARATQPFQVWNRPVAVLTNAASASDAEVFPNGFREYGLGKIIGAPTAGSVIGTVDITLVDGTRFRVPRTGWYTLSGRPMENHGVQPDILVEMSPADYAADNDRQLEAAVAEVMAEISRKPAPVAPARKERDR